MGDLVSHLRFSRPLILVLALTALVLACGETEKVAEENGKEVVLPGKEDNFFSLSAQEYFVYGKYYVDLEEKYAEATEEERIARVQELIQLKQISVNWFLLQYLVGQEEHDNKYKALTKNGSYADLEITQDPENPLHYTYKFQQEVAGQMSLISALDAQPQDDGTYFFLLPVGKVSNTDLAKLEINREWYRRSPWSSFDPTKVDAALVEELGMYIKAEERSVDAWPDYSRLFEDGVVEIGLHFGWDYHKEYHLVHSKDVYNWLVDTKGFKSPVASYDEYTRESGPLTRTILANGKPVEIRVTMFWGKKGTSVDTDTNAGGKQLEDDMRASFKNREVIIYSGHSGPFYGFALANWNLTDEGDLDDSEIPSMEMPENTYQVVLAEGCDTYAMGEAFWHNPAKEDQLNLDIITTTNFSNASTAGVVKNFLLSIMDFDASKNDVHMPWKYSKLMEKLDGNSYWFQSMYGIHGIDDNPHLNPYSDLDTVCSSCVANSDCGEFPGNGDCVMMGPESVCLVECTATDGCPEGYTCNNVAESAYLTSDMRCVPTSFSCN